MTCDGMSILTFIHPDDGVVKVRFRKEIHQIGPVYLVLRRAVVSIGLPSFLPFSSTYSSGIIMPTFRTSLPGFFLRIGGYYSSLSDYTDLALLGEIYTKGSWDCRLFAHQTGYKFGQF